MAAGEDPENCWDFWKCGRSECKAFTTGTGRYCWMVVGSTNKDPSCPKLTNEFEYCWDCPWFKKVNPGF